MHCRCCSFQTRRIGYPSHYPIPRGTRNTRTVLMRRQSLWKMRYWLRLVIVVCPIMLSNNVAWVLTSFNAKFRWSTDSRSVQKRLDDEKYSIGEFPRRKRQSWGRTLDGLQRRKHRSISEVDIQHRRWNVGTNCRWSVQLRFCKR